jgi:hypothetical protein
MRIGGEPSEWPVADHGKVRIAGEVRHVPVHHRPRAGVRHQSANTGVGRKHLVLLLLRLCVAGKVAAGERQRGGE